jgi:exopolysaccharide production protein ExoZ
MERGGWALRNRFLLELGAASYALYLFHLIIVQILVKLAKSSLAVSPALSAMLAVAASIGVAMLVHRRVEQPILRWSRRLARHPRGHARPRAAALAIPAAE